MDRTLSHGFFKNAMISPGLHERRVCSFDRDQISCKFLHLYERRVCSFDRNQMVQILILRFTLTSCTRGYPPHKMASPFRLHSLMK